MSATRKFGNDVGIGRRCDRYMSVKGTSWRATLALGAAALMIASCSSDSNSGPGPEPPVTGASTAATEQASTTMPATTPDAMAPATDPPATTDSNVASTTEAPDPPVVSTTEATIGTPAPATTPAPRPELVSEEGAAAAVTELFDLWTACLEELPDCDPALIASNYVGEYSDVVFVQVTGWADEGFSFTNTESRRNRIESVSIDADAGTAAVIACEDDGAVLSNGSGVVVDDRYVSLRREWTLAVNGERWIGTGITDLDRAEGQENELCDAL